MDNNFLEKLKLYKEGHLSEDEAVQVEYDIDKFIAISDYLNNDEAEFFQELKQQQIPQSNINYKVLKRRLNLRIILTTASSVILALIIIIFLLFTASKATTSLLGLNYKESYSKREIAIQLAEMFQPQYKSTSSSVSSSLFAQQSINIKLENTIGNTKVDDSNIDIKYSFGKAVKSESSKIPILIFDDIFDSTDHESNQISGFQILENAPKGTKAKILIEFNKLLSAEDIKENFMNKIVNTDIVPVDITPIASIGSSFILANPSYYVFRPVFPYSSSSTKELEGTQDQYVNMDNQAHKESLIGNLYTIKDNLDLLQVMYYEDMFKDINFDDLIKNVEDNGAKYTGIYITGDSKELLKFKDSPLIHCMRVQNIVIW